MFDEYDQCEAHRRESELDAQSEQYERQLDAMDERLRQAEIAAQDSSLEAAQARFEARQDEHETPLIEIDGLTTELNAALESNERLEDFARSILKAKMHDDSTHGWIRDRWEELGLGELPEGLTCNPSK